MLSKNSIALDEETNLDITIIQEKLELELEVETEIELEVEKEIELETEKPEPASMQFERLYHAPSFGEKDD